MADQRFSAKSDVWAYAVTCFEVWTGGATPYGALNNARVMQFVKDGGKLPIPPFCPRWFHDGVLKACFLKDPGEDACMHG